ncbi:hypothetical protein I7412_03715 [Frankia sp. CN6]|uniref:Uncharacterized protein n=1 Tax=Frankia nepalensis TaxID=1836974 RepID=A0A937UNI7_9ACTN|nr:hypothetical protein [Frankia nepalensis]MBL7626295.1 hypothetical protein [Frankia nepalensis]
MTRSVLGIALAGGVAAVLIVAGPGLADLPAGVSDVPDWFSAAPEQALVTAVAAAAWACLLWLCLGVVVGSFAALPGAAGRGAGRLARWMLPRALHRALEVGLGLTIVASSASGLLATSASASVLPRAPAAAMPDLGLPSTTGGAMPDLSLPSTTRTPAPPAPSSAGMPDLSPPAAPGPAAPPPAPTPGAAVGEFRRREPAHGQRRRLRHQGRVGRGRRAVPRVQPVEKPAVLKEVERVQRGKSAARPLATHDRGTRPEDGQPTGQSAGTPDSGRQIVDRLTVGVRQRIPDDEDEVDVADERRETSVRETANRIGAEEPRPEPFPAGVDSPAEHHLTFAGNDAHPSGEDALDPGPTGPR